MITRGDLWRHVEMELKAKGRLSYAEARRFFNALHRESLLFRRRKNLPLLEELKADLRLAKALNQLNRS